MNLARKCVSIIYTLNICNMMMNYVTLLCAIIELHKLCPSLYHSPMESYVISSLILLQLYSTERTGVLLRINKLDMKKRQYRIPFKRLKCVNKQQEVSFYWIIGNTLGAYLLNEIWQNLRPKHSICMLCMLCTSWHSVHVPNQPQIPN